MINRKWISRSSENIWPSNRGYLGSKSKDFQTSSEITSSEGDAKKEKPVHQLNQLNYEEEAGTQFASREARGLEKKPTQPIVSSEARG